MADSSGASSRAAAAQAIDAVLSGRSNLDTALAKAAAAEALSERDRTLCHALAFGTLRLHERNRFLISKLTKKPFRRRDQIIEALLSVGLFALTESHRPSYAVVSATVDAAVLLGRAPLRGVVNAVLRRFLREREELLAAAAEVDTARWQHPEWLLDAFKQDWPDDWQRIAAAGNEQAPMWLRLNTQVRSRDDWLQNLPDDIKVAAAPDEFPAAVRLRDAVPVDSLPGFSTGSVSVQDAGAQLAAGLLDCQTGMRVLDACAAPGGKTGHILELCPEPLDLVALDRDGERLERVQENITRLRRSATIVKGDLLRPERWWDREPFDRILLDVPCSATGVIRRHPDIRYLRKPSDISTLAARQTKLLRAAWKMLKPGGLLLYVTCSVLAAENATVVGGFLAAREDASEQPLPAELQALTSGSLAHGVQLLPGTAATDGFYYALMKRAEA